jgi:hypothetical protein
MNYALLREWLSLPPGPWPPTDRDLLGVAKEGAIDATTVELNALKRMDVLRPHQLRHPELVTEGMNRLAQALIAMTSGDVAPIAEVPEKKPKKTVKERTPVEIRKPRSEVKLELDWTAGLAPRSTTPAILDAEVIGVESAPAARDFIPESFAVQADEPSIPALDEPISIPEPPPGTVLAPTPRRQGYRELVRMRRYRVAWDKFRSVLGDPSEMLLSPVKITNYLDAIALLRTARQQKADPSNLFPDTAGYFVISVTSHPVPLSLLRDLVSSQRRILARDWAVASAELDAKTARLRRLMSNTRRKRFIPRPVNRIANVFSRNPEWILVAVLVTALVIGFIRS